MDNIIIGKGKIFGKAIFANRSFKKGEIVIKYKLKALTSGEFKNLPKSEKVLHMFIGDKFIFIQYQRDT